jgi:hypothetical protein
MTLVYNYMLYNRRIAGRVCDKFAEVRSRNSIGINLEPSYGICILTRNSVKSSVGIKLRLKMSVWIGFSWLRRACESGDEPSVSTFERLSAFREGVCSMD